MSAQPTSQSAGNPKNFRGRPNILYIHSHDTGRYIQPYGHAVPTPRLQQLAEEGVLFRQAFCVNPTCSPSRACLLTGSYAHQNGMLGLAHRGFTLNDYRQHLLHQLSGQGYTTALAGVQHIATARDGKEAPEVIGYDHFLGNYHSAHETAVEFLKMPRDEPFFLSVGFFETHREFPTLDEAADDPRYCLPPTPFPDTPQVREDMVRYKASARSLDAKIGMILDALDSQGLAENTLVICTTDHGIAFPKMKCHLHDNGTGVLLIMRGPGQFTGGKVIDAMVSHLDVFPTVCDLLQIDPPSWLEGQSLGPLVRGETEDLHEELFAEVNFHAAYEPLRSVRTKRWKYIRRYDQRAKPVMSNCDEGESRSFWIEHGLSDIAVESEMLYDLMFDPNEANNRIDAPFLKDIANQMRDRLERWMHKTQDPLLGGSISAPAGALVNDPDDFSPTDAPRVV